MTETSHSNSMSYKMRPDVAHKRIESFAKRFGPDHLFFAQHAAFPLVLTPQLAYRLWSGFQQDIHGKKRNIPWIAVADLLLSSLCDEVSHELYEMNITIRELLLNGLQDSIDLGFQRIQELSAFLLKNIEHQLDSDDSDVRDIAAIQRWTALAYVEPGDTARELAEAIGRTIEQNNSPELLRLSSLVETFAQPLASFTPLLIYARGIGHFVRGDMSRAWDQMKKLATSDQSVQIQDLYLPIPQQVREAALQNISTVQAEKSNESSMDLTSWLWNVADIFRGAVDVARYKEFIFPLICYKRLSDIFDDKIQRYINIYGNEQLAYQRIADDRQQELSRNKISADHFFIPKECRWAELQNHARQNYHELGSHVNDVLRTIVHMNPDLRGILDLADYQERQGGKQVLGDQRLASLIETLSRYRLGLQDVDPNDLAQAFDNLLQMFSEAEGKRGDEFYTPKEVGRLMAHLLSPEPQSTIYDPACGSGGFLIAASQYSEGNKTLKLFGQEINPIASSIAKMNVFLHNDLDAKIAVGDSLSHPLFVLKGSELQTFDYILSNPPWNQKIENASIFEHDPWRRFERFGPPPRSSSAWAWLEHIYASLNKNGRAAVVLPLGVLFRGHREREIRQGFVEEDVIECIIQLPANLFYGTGIPCAIIMLNRNKSVEHKKQILLINASSFAEKGRRKNTLASQGITIITELYQGWETREKLSRVITQEEARSADYNLLPSRFIRPQSAECLVLAITDLSVIHEAFQACLTDVKKIVSPWAVVYTKGVFVAESFSWDIVIVQIGPGNESGVSEIERAVSYWGPEVVLSLGLAGRGKDVRIGDVVIATKVYGSSDIQTPTNSLLLKAQAIAQNDHWLRWVKPAVSQPAPCVVVAPVASTHTADPLTPRLLRRQFNDAVAIDFARYSLVQNSYASLTIRGICEEISAPKEAKAQKRVAQYVSAFVCELLTNLEPEEILQQASSKRYLGLVAVPYEEFEEFLRDQENELWVVDKPSLNVGRPTDVEDLMKAIIFHGNGDGLVYVFRGDMLEEEVVEATNWRAIPQINKEALGDYVIISDRKEKDFLRFDCTPEEASNCNPIVLMRYKEESSEDEEYSELEEDRDLGVAKISYEEFERFLRDQKHKYWSVDKPAIGQFLPGRSTVDELMVALDVAGDGMNRLYIFSEDCNLEKIATGIDWNRVPEIHQGDLGGYIVTPEGMGHDFLYFDCTLDAASMGNPAILLFHEENDDIDEESSYNDATSGEYYGLVAASYNDFENFLREQENELWQITKPSVPGYVPEYPLKIEELMGIIGQRSDGNQLIYLFRGDLEERKIIEATDLRAIPEIKNLYNYLIRSTSSKELLRFDCDLNEAIAAKPIILVPYADDTGVSSLVTSIFS
ncbi:MAG TPA: N-6 DNA methylase [Ktedonobacteraceae bacterium]|nr:N-6 DNA methylase [Ktedonobacteraceae bacterium]